MVECKILFYQGIFHIQCLLQTYFHRFLVLRFFRTNHVYTINSATKVRCILPSKHVGPISGKILFRSQTNLFAMVSFRNSYDRNKRIGS